MSVETRRRASNTLRHWYFVSADYCPVCGRESETRERRFDKRPKRYEDRHEVREVWDYCDAL